MKKLIAVTTLLLIASANMWGQWTTEKPTKRTYFGAHTGICVGSGIGVDAGLDFHLVCTQNILLKAGPEFISYDCKHKDERFIKIPLTIGYRICPSADITGELDLGAFYARGLKCPNYSPWWNTNAVGMRGGFSILYNVFELGFHYEHYLKNYKGRNCVTMDFGVLF